jgi:hypothetical protein
MEGQAFLPKNSCMKCICQKGFSDKIEEPFCKPMPCGQQLKNWKHIQDRCAPLYEKNLDALCCPIGWVCRKFCLLSNVMFKSQNLFS